MFNYINNFKNFDNKKESHEMICENARLDTQEYLDKYRTNVFRRLKVTVKYHKYFMMKVFDLFDCCKLYYEENFYKLTENNTIIEFVKNNKKVFDNFILIEYAVEVLYEKYMYERHSKDELSKVNQTRIKALIYAGSELVLTIMHFNKLKKEHRVDKMLREDEPDFILTNQKPLCNRCSSEVEIDNSVISLLPTYYCVKCNEKKGENQVIWRMDV